MKIRILTIGNSSMITSVILDRFPNPGQPVTAEKYAMRPGGHGLLTAIAISKLGGDSVFCSAVGEDGYAGAIRDICRGYGVDTRFVVCKSGVRTGASSLIYSDGGVCTPIEIPGSNLRLDEEDIEDAFTCLPDALLIQGRGIAASLITYAVNEAGRRKIPVIADLSGADAEMPLENLKETDIIIVDSEAAEAFTGVLPSGEQTCLRAAGIIEQRVRTKYTIILLDDKRGIFLSDNKYHEMLSPFSIIPVDLSASVESYIGALTFDYIRGSVDRGRDINHACTYAALAKAWTLATKGSASSMPTSSELVSLVKNNSIDFTFYD